MQCTSRIKEMIVSQLFGTIINLGTLLVVVIYMIKKFSHFNNISVVHFHHWRIDIFWLIRPIMSQAINGEVIEQTKLQAAQIRIFICDYYC